jgi:hypothetical protein
MIKILSDTSKTIYPCLYDISDNANSNYYLMEVENEQTKVKVAKVLTKGEVTERSVALNLDDTSINLVGTPTVDSRIDLDNLDGLLQTQNPFTLAVWFKCLDGTVSNVDTIFSAASSSLSVNFIISLDSSGRIRLEQYLNNVHIFNGNYKDGLWHRLVVSSHGGTSKLTVYVDGNKLGHTTQTFYVNWDYLDSLQLGVNKDGYNVSDYYNGDLKNFQLWDYMLHGDDVKFDYNNPDLLASDREPNVAPTNRNLKSWFKLQNITSNTFFNYYNDNFLNYPNTFSSWDVISATNIQSDVEYSKNGFQIADRIQYDGTTDNPVIEQTINSVPVTGQWNFGLWVKGKGNTIGKKGKLDITQGTASIISVPTEFTYSDEWQYIECFAYIISFGTFIVSYQYVKTIEDYPSIEKGNEVYAYGARLKNYNYNLNASLVGSGSITTEATPMFDFENNTFYKYKIYEQTNKDNVNIPDDTILGLSQSGKLFVEGNSSVEYVKQPQENPTNSVYLKI